MKRILFGIVGLLLLAPTAAMAQPSASALAEVVTACAGKAYSVGSQKPVTQTAAGSLCTSGGGGGAVTIAGGADVTEGTIGDTNSTGTVVGFLKDMWTALTTGPVPVSAVSLPLPAGASTSALQTTGNTSLSTLAAAVGNAIPAGSAIIGKVGIDQTTPGTTNGVAATNFPTTVSVNTGATGASSPRVTVAVDSATVAGSATLPAGTNSVGGVTIRPSATFGATAYGLQSAASTNSTSVKGSAGTLLGLNPINTTTTIYYLRMYDASSAPTCSSATNFSRTWPVPPASAAGGAGGIAVHLPVSGVAFANGIAFCLTGGPTSTDNTNAATGVFINLDYN